MSAYSPIDLAGDHEEFPSNHPFTKELEPQSPQEVRLPVMGNGAFRALIVDGDSQSRKTLRDLLLACEDLTFAEAESIAEARILLRQYKPDILFLEFDLVERGGLQLVDELRANVALVVVNRSAEAAMAAFDCAAMDFLLKPFNPERVRKTLQRFRQRSTGRKPITTGKSRLQDSLLVKTLTEKKIIKASEVTHIAAYGEYSWVYWNNDNRGALMRKSLKQWVAELPSDRFIRIHRRSIINLAYLKGIERLANGRVQVHLRDMPEPILVSLRLAPALNRKLKALAKSGRAIKA